MPTAARIQEQQWAAQVAQQNATGVAHTTGGVTDWKKFYADIDALNNGIAALQQPLATTKTNMLAATSGGVNTTYAPANETGLALDTFRNTLAMFFGNEAKTASWVTALYDTVSKFYKTGSSVDDSLNLALQDARNNPALKPFTDRFRGVFALQDKLLKGEAVHVPTIAEYTEIQNRMSDVLKQAGLDSMATLDFTSDLISKNVSAAEMTNRLNDAFLVIDNADPFLKQQFAEYFPMLSRNDLAKGLLLGDAGAIELEQKVKGIEVKSAAAQQGLVATDPFALAKSGVSYEQAKQGYEAIAQMKPGMENLSAIYGETGNAMQTLESATFGTPGSADAQQKIKRVARREQNTFGGSSGVGAGSLGVNQTAGTL